MVPIPLGNSKKSKTPPPPPECARVGAYILHTFITFRIHKHIRSIHIHKHGTRFFSRLSVFRCSQTPSVRCRTGFLCGIKYLWRNNLLRRFCARNKTNVCIYRIEIICPRSASSLPNSHYCFRVSYKFTYYMYTQIERWLCNLPPLLERDPKENEKRRDFDVCTSKKYRGKRLKPLQGGRGGPQLLWRARNPTVCTYVRV